VLSHPAPQPGVIPLGNLELLATQAEGTREFMSGGNMIERWYSNGLQLTMILRTVTETGTGLTQITALALGDPPSAVFSLAADYNVVQETSPFVIK
jgi:hypothetical protein